jgi:hypothetical protein
METTGSSEDLFNKVQRLNWTLAVIVKVYSALVHAATEYELYGGLCDSVTEQKGVALAWIGVPVDDANKTLQVTARAGEAGSYLDGISVSWGNNKNGDGPAGRAIRTGKVQFFNNLQISRQFAPWMERAKKYHLQSAFSLPITLATGEVVATLTVYSDMANAFYNDELKLLEQISTDLGYGVGSLRARFAHEDAYDHTRNGDGQGMAASHPPAHDAGRHL